MRNSFMFLVLFSLFACKQEKEETPDVGNVTLRAECKQMDDIIRHYSNRSNMGIFFWKQDSILKESMAAFKKTVIGGHSITREDQLKFFDYFEKIMKNSNVVDVKTFDTLRNVSIRSISDVDYIENFIKNCMVSVLSQSKSLPFDIMYCTGFPESSTIKAGEEFKVILALAANSTTNPIEWYLVRSTDDSLKMGNILDTLHSDQFGIANFKTTEYKEGKNKLGFICRIKTPGEDYLLSREITFTVR